MLLTRQQFNERVFKRDKHKCVFCKKPAVDAHHILDRKLFLDGGYYLDNGASVCEDCHLRCEQCDLTVEEVRAACGITNVVLPPELSPDVSYDKWGKVNKMFKYPRTRHIRGSRFQEGDHDLEAAPWEELEGNFIVSEEKMDGANCGMSFSAQGDLLLQSRGHYLTGGPREKHFSLLKQWASVHQEAFFYVLGSRYVMYGEWMYAKHTMFYDALPHYFMEFDVFDTENSVFLSTEARQELLYGSDVKLPVIQVKVLADGRVSKLKELESLIIRSHFVTDDRQKNLIESAARAGVSAEDATTYTDPSSLMEGLYVKHEEDGIVKGRYKFVRSSFTNSIMEQDTHWLNRPIIQNVLLPGAYEAMFSQDY
jgi:hypothetical protein